MPTPSPACSRAEVLAHCTRANTWFLGGQDENLPGSLEVGRLGDVAVLSDGHFAVTGTRLRSRYSQLTVVGGTLVHEGGIRFWA